NTESARNPLSGSLWRLAGRLNNMICEKSQKNYLIRYVPQLRVAGQLLRRNPAKNDSLSILIGPFLG
ncbi:MAG: hypothetical protein CO125_06220, partial [Hydrogenophilales bacterium CG_4_9_14_3_um_filter_59_35]